MTWTTTATLPQPQTGLSWTTSATLPTVQTGPGWFEPTHVERVAELSATGTLSANVATSYPYTTAPFTGTGTLSATVKPVKTITAAFTATGTLIGFWLETKPVTVNFSATGTLAAPINDGLSGIITGGTPLTDGLSGIVTGGLYDGLSATVVAGVSAFTGSGSLTVTATMIGGAAGSVSGTGSSTITATLAGNGVVARTATGAALTATATLAGSGVAAVAATGTVLSVSATITGAGVVARSSTSTALTATATLTGVGAVGYAATSTALTATATISGAGLVSTSATSTTCTATAAITGVGAVALAATSTALTVTTTVTGAGTVVVPSVATFDTTAGPGAETKPVSGVARTWSHTASGSNRVGIVVMHWYNGNGTSVSSSATWGGAAMTSLGVQTDNNVGQNTSTASWIQFFGILNPASGAQTVSVTVTHNGTSNSWASTAHSFSYTGVGSFGTIVKGWGAEAGTALSQTITSATNNRPFAAFAHFSVPAITSFNQTQRWSQAGTSLADAVVVGDAAGASSVTFTAVRTSGVIYAEMGLDLVHA